ncbi:MAG: hypothetical protein WC389_03600 [Lutibacter sp.]|jgi:hypothetical protein
MKEREICEKIIEQKDCKGIHCMLCPHILTCEGSDNPCDPVAMSQQWLDDNPEFQKGEIIFVGDYKNNMVFKRIFLNKMGIYFNCVYQQTGNFNEAKEKYLSGKYKEGLWTYAKKYKGEIVKSISEKDQIETFVEKNRKLENDLFEAIKHLGKIIDIAEKTLVESGALREELNIIIKEIENE